MKPFIPLRHTLDLNQPGTPVTDRFGNERPGTGHWETIKVASWWIDRTEEKSEDSILRTVEHLHAHVPSDVEISPASRLRTPDGEEWEIQGRVENFSHGFHKWDPGLKVVHATKVRG